MKKCRSRTSRIADLRSRLTQLTPREHEVFELLVRGKPHKQIAFALNVSERTIKAHRHNIMQKFHVQSLAELAVIAERLQLLPTSGQLNKPIVKAPEHLVALPLWAGSLARRVCHN